MNRPRDAVQPVPAVPADPAVSAVPEASALSAGTDAPAERLPRDAAARMSGAQERGGDPACWLRRVCQHCGSMADEDPPTTCPACHAAMPGE
jgi:hypothetical protein